MAKAKKPTLAEQLKEQKEAMEQMKQLLAESEAKREQQQLDIETIEAKRAEEAEKQAKLRAEEAEKQAKLRAIEESKRRTGGNINTTLSEYHYNYIHDLAKQQHSRAATIVRSIIEDYCEKLTEEA